jgi:flagellar protein FlbD
VWPGGVGLRLARRQKGVCRVIRVTKLNGVQVYVNAEFVETVAATPDTVITLTNGSRIIVSEPVEQVVSEIIRYRRRVNRRAVIVERWAE